MEDNKKEPKSTRAHLNTAKTKKSDFDYLEVVKAFARITYKSIYIIDYQKKEFEYVSNNPLFLCGHSAKEVKEMGFSFYKKYIPEADWHLLLKIKDLGYAFYHAQPIEQRKNYTLSCDFHLGNPKKQPILVHQELTPLCLTSKGDLWKSICTVSLSTASKAGNVQLFKAGSKQKWKYDFKLNAWQSEQKAIFSTRELQILHWSIRGYTTNEIATLIFVSADTVKFHRKKILEKLQVKRMPEAIRYAIINKLF